MTKVFRQNDAEFVQVLNELRLIKKYKVFKNIRHGTVSQQAIKMLNSCVRPLESDNGIEATQLFALNKVFPAFFLFAHFSGCKSN